MARHEVFLTGSSGFLGSALAAELFHRSHRVRALVRRPGSESRVAVGCEVIHGDALNAASYSHNVGGCDTFVHLVGVAHPSPGKAELSRQIDLVWCGEASGRPALCLSERGPSCGDDEGLSGSARWGRTDDS